MNNIRQSISDCLGKFESGNDADVDQGTFLWFYNAVEGIDVKIENGTLKTPTEIANAIYNDIIKQAWSQGIHTEDWTDEAWFLEQVVALRDSIVK